MADKKSFTFDVILDNLWISSVLNIQIIIYLD